MFVIVLCRGTFGAAASSSESPTSAAEKGGRSYRVQGFAGGDTTALGHWDTSYRLIVKRLVVVVVVIVVVVVSK